MEGHAAARQCNNFCNSIQTSPVRATLTDLDRELELAPCPCPVLTCCGRSCLSPAAARLGSAAAPAPHPLRSAPARCKLQLQQQQEQQEPQQQIRPVLPGAATASHATAAVHVAMAGHTSSDATSLKPSASDMQYGCDAVTKQSPHAPQGPGCVSVTAEPRGCRHLGTCFSSSSSKPGQCCCFSNCCCPSHTHPGMHTASRRCYMKQHNIFNTFNTFSSA